MIQITEVKAKGGAEIRVSYVETDGAGTIRNHVVTSNEKPRPELLQGLDSLSMDLMNLLGIACVSGKADEMTSVTGCSFKYPDSGGFEAVIKEKIYVPYADEDVAICTPSIATRPKDGRVGPYLPEETEKKIRTVLKKLSCM
ncbi:MAG: hypothetical protein I3I94_09000 [Acidaminococcaceae bacterium]|nr:hypothetical protein [Acidaminococcaceae bacterium]